jgi:hypothetical protein
MLRLHRLWRRSAASYRTGRACREVAEPSWRMSLPGLRSGFASVGFEHARGRTDVGEVERKHTTGQADLLFRSRAAVASLWS